MMLTSIIIPCFNARRWLRAAVASCLAQTYQDVEIWVVDDGSTDDCLERIADIGDPRLNVIRQPNRGASAARNAGVLASRGAWVQFLDADDLLDEAKIQIQIERLDRQPNGVFVASGSWGRFYDDLAEHVHILPDELCADLDGPTFLRRALYRDRMMHPAAWLVPRALIDRCGMWDESLSLNDDGEFFARCVLASDGIVHCPGALSKYRSGDVETLSGVRSARACDSALRALDSIVEGLLSVEQTSRARSAAAVAYTRLAVELYPHDSAAARRAAGRARELGHYEPQTTGGRWVQLLSRLFGWRVARRVQWLIYRAGYQRWQLERRKARSSS